MSNVEINNSNIYIDLSQWQKALKKISSNQLDKANVIAIRSVLNQHKNKLKPLIPMRSGLARKMVKAKVSNNKRRGVITGRIVSDTTYSRYLAVGSIEYSLAFYSRKAKIRNRGGIKPFDFYTKFYLNYGKKIERDAIKKLIYNIEYLASIN